jgi:modified peptide precursor CbpA
MKKETRKMKEGVISCRKKCKSNGTGLSHYVLLEKKAKA